MRRLEPTPTLAQTVRTQDFPESHTRPAGLPPEVPFVQGLSCQVMYPDDSDPASFAVQWPVTIPRDSPLAAAVRELMPAPHVYVEHPRRLLAIIEGLVPILREIDEDDARLGILDTLTEEARNRLDRLPEPSGPESWMQPDAMQRFWDIYDAAATPGAVVVRLHAGFDAAVQELEQQGWMVAHPPEGWPLRTRDRVRYFEMSDADRCHDQQRLGQPEVLPHVEGDQQTEVQCRVGGEGPGAHAHRLSGRSSGVREGCPPLP